MGSADPQNAQESTLHPVPAGEIVSLLRSRHIDYPALAIYLRNALGEKAWGKFLERYGIPPVIITMPELADGAQGELYMEKAVQVAEGGSGALPYGSIVSYANEARGVNPFAEFLDHQQKLIVLMATGGMLTSLTSATGIGSGATSAHEETWRTIVRRDASAIATELNKTVSRTLLSTAFPGKPALAAFDFQTRPTPSALEVFEVASKAVAAGYRVSKEELEERTGYTLVESAPASPSPLASGFAFNKKPPKTQPIAPEPGVLALEEALKRDLSPVALAIQAFLNAPTKAGAEALIARLPELCPEDPALSSLLEQELAKAFALEAVQNTSCHAQDPAACSTHGSHPGQGQRERETPRSTDAFGSTSVSKLASNPEANEKRARSVISHLLAKQGGEEAKALYRKDTGWIGVDFGTPGNAKHDYKGGHGLSHILAKHPGAEEKLPEVLLKGECYKHNVYPSKLYLIYGDAVAVLAKHRTGRLLITDYEEVPAETIKQYKAKGKYHAKGENEEKKGGTPADTAP